MMESGFICASANLDNLDPEASGIPILDSRVDNANFEECYE